MNVVVTGGSGGLGREVVSRLRDRQVRTVAASRRTGFDLATGEGVRAVLADADVVVHAATNVRFRKVDLDGTRRIIRILQERPQPPHLIYVSIVGRATATRTRTTGRSTPASWCWSAAGCR